MPRCLWPGHLYDNCRSPGMFWIMPRRCHSQCFLPIGVPPLLSRLVPFHLNPAVACQVAVFGLRRVVANRSCVIYGVHPPAPVCVGECTLSCLILCLLVVAPPAVRFCFAPGATACTCFAHVRPPAFNPFPVHMDFLRWSEVQGEGVSFAWLRAQAQR